MSTDSGTAQDDCQPDLEDIIDSISEDGPAERTRSWTYQYAQAAQQPDNLQYEMNRLQCGNNEHTPSSS